MLAGALRLKRKKRRLIDKNERPLQFAIIGCGLIGSKRLAALTPDVSVTSFGEAVRAVLEKAARRSLLRGSTPA
jgi:hypothetical protein